MFDVSYLTRALRHRRYDPEDLATARHDGVRLGEYLRGRLRLVDAIASDISTAS